jgi:hypothetical protein
MGIDRNARRRIVQSAGEQIERIPDLGQLIQVGGLDFALKVDDGIIINHCAENNEWNGENEYMG